jgi:hypothetical protein
MWPTQITQNHFQLNDFFLLTNSTASNNDITTHSQMKHSPTQSFLATFVSTLPYIIFKQTTISVSFPTCSASPSGCSDRPTLRPLAPQLKLRLRQNERSADMNGQADYSRLHLQPNDSALRYGADTTRNDGLSRWKGVGPWCRHQPTHLRWLPQISFIPQPVLRQVHIPSSNASSPHSKI